MGDRDNTGPFNPADNETRRKGRGREQKTEKETQKSTEISRSFRHNTERESVCVRVRADLAVVCLLYLDV